MVQECYGDKTQINNTNIYTISPLVALAAEKDPRAKEFFELESCSYARPSRQNGKLSAVGKDLKKAMAELEKEPASIAKVIELKNFLRSKTVTGGVTICHGGGSVLLNKN